MHLDSWIPFVLATTVILVIPGPTIILVISQAVAHGRKSVVPLVAGVLLGDFTAMTLSLLGLGALLATSAALFTVFKWVGALYLCYLGMRLWRLSPGDCSLAGRKSTGSPGSLLKKSFVVTALNPKSIAFFVAFLPQFVDSSRAAAPQLTLFGGTFLVLATLNATLYALFAGRLSDRLQKANIRKWFNRCGACALIGAGIFAAGVQRQG